jgi:glycoside/pentoside/hexuronide:cation symporter, GPH family
MSNIDTKIDKSKQDKEIRNSTLIHLSYGVGGFLDNFLTAAFTIRVLGFYEDEILVPIILVGIAYVLYGIWNMVNDPLAGHISDKPRSFTKKWGRRFPWFIVSVFPCALVYYLIFSVPFTEALFAFFWLLIMICLFDTFYSFWTISWNAIFPDKFRSEKERTKVSGIYSILGMVGLAVGMIVPPLFIEYGVPHSYTDAALIVMGLSFICAILMIPSMKEDEEMIERVLSIEEKKEKPSFLETLKFGLKQKNFIAILILYLAQMIVTVLMLGTLYYWVRYVLLLDATFEIFISASFLIGSMVSVPLWVKLGRKYGNKWAITLGAGLTIAFFVPFIFVSSLLGSIISTMLIGVGVGCVWTLRVPAFSDVIDEFVLKTERRQEGSYWGIMTFFGRISIVIQAVSVAIVHEITGYIPAAEFQTPFAIFGIRILMALIPMGFYIVGLIFMWKIYDLDKEKVGIIQTQLKELNL